LEEHTPHEPIQHQFLSTRNPESHQPFFAGFSQTHPLFFSNLYHFQYIIHDHSISSSAFGKSFAARPILKKSILNTKANIVEYITIFFIFIIFL
jgi:hypothetical protein